MPCSLSEFELKEFEILIKSKKEFTIQQTQGYLSNEKIKKKKENL